MTLLPAASISHNGDILTQDRRQLLSMCQQEASRQGHWKVEGHLNDFGPKIQHNKSAKTRCSPASQLRPWAPVSPMLSLSRNWQGPPRTLHLSSISLAGRYRNGLDRSVLESPLYLISLHCIPKRNVSTQVVNLVFNHTDGCAPAKSDRRA